MGLSYQLYCRFIQVKEIGKFIDLCDYWYNTKHYIFYGAGHFMLCGRWRGSNREMERYSLMVEQQLVEL